MDNRNNYAPNNGQQENNEEEAKPGSAVILIPNNVEISKRDLGKMWLTPQNLGNTSTLGQHNNKITIPNKWKFDPNANHIRDNIEYDPIKEMEAKPVPISTPSWISDPYAARFRYGLSTTTMGKHFEDPTYFGFVLDLDLENSPLFNTNQNLNNATTFLQKYGGLGYIGFEERLKVLNWFNAMIKSFFAIPDDIGNINDSYRPYYIKSVSGLDKLADQFAKSYDTYSETKKDASFIEVEMNEDVAMTAQYVAKLYNDLKWSYSTGRAMIPSNLLKFNLAIKISEMRNMRSITLENAIENGTDFLFDYLDTESLIQIDKAIRVNTSSLNYYLYDCEFDFSQSYSHESSIDSGTAEISKGIKFKIYYKGVRRVIRPTLLFGLPLDDGRQDLNLSANDSFNPETGDTSEKTQDGQLQDESGYYIYDSFKGEGVKLTNLYKFDERSENLNQNRGEDAKPSPAAPGSINPNKKDLGRSFQNNTIGGFRPDAIGDLNPLSKINRSNLLDQAKGVVTNAVNNAGANLLQRAKEAYLKARSELVNRALYRVRETLGIKKINPSNVYKKTATLGTILDNLKGEIGFGVQNILTRELFEKEKAGIDKTFNTSKGKFKLK